MIERLNIIDVTANLEEQWVIDNKPNKPICKYNKRNEEEEVSKDLTLNIDTIHVYPASVTRFIEHFLMPASSFTLVSGSQESIMSFEDSDVSTFNFCTIPLTETKNLKKKNILSIVYVNANLNILLYRKEMPSIYWLLTMHTLLMVHVRKMTSFNRKWIC